MTVLEFDKSTPTPEGSWCISEVRFGKNWHNNLIVLPWAGGKIRIMNCAKIILNSSQAFRVRDDIANTGVKLKLKSDQRFWRYNNFNKEKGMLSNFHNRIFVIFVNLSD
jgi:hypothetical protein